jgi:hypothetical protein
MHPVGVFYNVSRLMHYTGKVLLRHIVHAYIRGILLIRFIPDSFVKNAYARKKGPACTHASVVYFIRVCTLNYFKLVFGFYVLNQFTFKHILRV